jgi:hypothetical protein
MYVYVLFVSEQNRVKERGRVGWEKLPLKTIARFQELSTQLEENIISSFLI